MEKPKDTTDTRSEWRKFCDQTYTEQDLYEFDRKLRQKYHTRRAGKNGEYDHFDIEQFLRDEGAIKEWNHLGHPVRHAVEADGKFKLEALGNKIEQWRRWQLRKEWGKQQAARQLDGAQVTDMPW